MFIDSALRESPGSSGLRQYLAAALSRRNREGVFRPERARNMVSYQALSQPIVRAFGPDTSSFHNKKRRQLENFLSARNHFGAFRSTAILCHLIAGKRKAALCQIQAFRGQGDG
jgi:hypothetical protein